MAGKIRQNCVQFCADLVFLSVYIGLAQRVPASTELSRQFGPVIKMNRLMRKTIQNDEVNRYAAEFKACMALDAIREKLTLDEMAEKHGVHPNMTDYAT